MAWALTSRARGLQDDFQEGPWVFLKWGFFPFFSYNRKRNITNSIFVIFQVLLSSTKPFPLRPQHAVSFWYIRLGLRGTLCTLWSAAVKRTSPGSIPQTSELMSGNSWARSAPREFMPLEQEPNRKKKKKQTDKNSFLLVSPANELRGAKIIFLQWGDLLVFGPVL